MGTLFLEYKIEESRLGEYLSWIRQRQAEHGFEVLEGSDQPGLYVELWRPVEHRDAELWRARRLDPADPVWSLIHGFAAGGASRIHIWHFRRVE